MKDSAPRSFKTLKSSQNADIYKTIEACEAHHTTTNLVAMKKDTEQAKTPQDILQALEQKQQFLSSPVVTICTTSFNNQ
jgi:hypothetical protein